MNTSQVKCVIQSDSILSTNVLGVFAADEIQLLTLQPSTGIIVNTDPVNKPGKHWVAFFLNQNKTLECFDSYGQSPSTYSVFLRKFIQKFQSTIINHKRAQSSDTNVCGQYCLFYMMCRCRGYDMDAIVDFFSNDYLTNDQFVYSFVQDRFYCCVTNSRNNM